MPKPPLPPVVRAEKGIKDLSERTIKGPAAVEFAVRRRKWLRALVRAGHDSREDLDEIWSLNAFLKGCGVQ